MKTSFLIAITIFVSGLQASAWDMTPKEFSAAFIEQTNLHLVDLNAQRSADGKKKLYCKQLDKYQKAAVLKAASIPGITAHGFVKEMAENLNCYGVYWEPLNPKTNKYHGHFGLMLVNTNAYVRNSVLASEVLEIMAKGRFVHDDEDLMNIVRW